MKRMVAVLLAVVLLVVAGCTEAVAPVPDPDQMDPVVPVAVEGPFKVALLVPSTVTDKGWSQSAYEALLLIERHLGAEISYVEAGPRQAKIEEAIRFAEEGYHLIFGHGFQYSEPFLQLSPLYPQTVFVTAGGEYVTDNQLVLENMLEQVTYVAGAIAANMTQTRKIACIGGVNIPSVAKTFEGFRRGIHSVDPGIDVHIAYVGSWDNINGGYEEALRLIDDGYDVLYPNANAVGLGVIKAADEQGVWVFGQSIDQSDLSPEHMIASMVENHRVSYMEIATRVLEGTWEPGQRVQFGLSQGVIDLVWNEQVRQELPPEILVIQQNLEARIKAGEIDIPSETEM